MKKAAILRMLAVFAGLVALTMIPCLIHAAVRGEDDMLFAFGVSIGGACLVAIPAAIFTKRSKIRISAADGFLLVFLAWVLSCVQGALPFFISGRIPDFSAAFFESASGFTTTGATIIADVEAMPHSLVLWRAMTHWLGGMGIVVLTVAILPLLGVGGFQLVKAETTGPEKEKFTPKITVTAKILWLIYFVLTALQVVLLLAGGMDLFEAVVHAFGTMATGGFSSRNASVAAFNSPYIEWVCTVFMLLAGFNFTLYYQLLRGKGADIIHNSEAKAYALIVVVSAALITLSVVPAGVAPARAIRHAFFHTASIITTTGFAACDINAWPPLAQLVIFTLMLVGGCSGSTAGGVKVIRHVVLFKQAKNEAKRLLFPRGVFNIRLNDKVGRKDVVYGVAGFIFIYFALAILATLLVALCGENPFVSLNAGLTMIGNIGLALTPDVASGAVFGRVTPAVRCALSLIMIAGRLELWTFFVLLTPEYWRR